uniref:Uncharacterized protein n=1 Tax=Tanacetum cinerariifolium TaxID=118510 RepID=A0A699IVT4_TANCI|nr:hypothetical protein [Tanacetum cinerariifolium]
MVIKSEVLYDFPGFFDVLIAKLTANGVVNFIFKMKRDMIVENLVLEPKINAMMMEFLDSFSISYAPRCSRFFWISWSMVISIRPAISFEALTQAEWVLRTSGGSTCPLAGTGKQVLVAPGMVTCLQQRVQSKEFDTIP